MWWRRAAFALNGKRGAPAWWRGLAPASPYPKPPKPAIAATRRRRAGAWRDPLGLALPTVGRFLRLLAACPRSLTHLPPDHAFGVDPFDCILGAIERGEDGLPDQSALAIVADRDSFQRRRPLDELCRNLGDGLIRRRSLLAPR